MPDYSRGKIYKMVSPSGLTYVGSTCEPTLARRKSGHYEKFKLWKNGGYHFITSFQLFQETENAIDIILIENYPCNSKDELHARERYYIETLQCVNKIIPCRTDKQYREDNKEAIKQKKKQYREENKEAIKQKEKQYREDNKEAIKEYIKQYREDNKEAILQKKKQYREDNKEAIKQKKKQYHEDNKEAINQKKNAKVRCQCGSTVSNGNVSRHKKTLTHIDKIALVSNQN